MLGAQRRDRHDRLLAPPQVADATIEATAAELLLLLWNRASGLDESAHFRVTGDPAVVRALERAPIHP